MPTEEQGRALLQYGGVDPAKDDWRSRRALVLGRVDGRARQATPPEGLTSGTNAMGASAWASFFKDSRTGAPRTSEGTQRAAALERKGMGLSKDQSARGIGASVLDQIFGTDGPSPAKPLIESLGQLPILSPETPPEDAFSLSLNNARNIPKIPNATLPSFTLSMNNDQNAPGVGNNPWASLAPAKPRPFSWL